jgi:hypothetical protein
MKLANSDGAECESSRAVFEGGSSKPSQRPQPLTQSYFAYGPLKSSAFCEPSRSRFAARGKSPLSFPEFFHKAKSPLSND